MRKRQTLLVVISVAAVVLLLFGSRMFYVIKPGERAVVFKTISGNLLKDKIVGTGLHMIAPWDRYFRYNVREVQREETMDVLDKNGLGLKVDITVRFNPTYDKIGFLHEIFGLDYINTLVVPEVRSSVRKVTGRYSAEEIYSTKRSEVETAIITETGKVLRDNHLDMRALLIRSITLPQDIKFAIESKLTREQEALAMTFINEKERLEAERKKIEAQGIADYNRIIHASITDKILKQKGIDATILLANSANAKVVVIGNSEDGLPLILGGN